MSAARSSKKENGKAANVLVPIVSLLVVALIAVVMLYLRLDSVEPSPSPDAEQTAAPGL